MDLEKAMLRMLSTTALIAAQNDMGLSDFNGALAGEPITKGRKSDEYKRTPREDLKAWNPSPLIRKEKKIGRNNSCPCGSGKKYKRCCI